MARTDKQSAWSEVFALILLFVGTLLFFALISYTPKDVPSWIWFSHISPSNHPAQNFIGPVGAIVAGICYQCIGVFASLLLAAVLLGFGAAKLFYPRLRVTPRIPWIVLFIVSGAACKDESAMVAHASCLWGRWPSTPGRPTGKMPVLLVIERRRRGITITRGGPHR